MECNFQTISIDEARENWLRGAKVSPSANNIHEDANAEYTCSCGSTKTHIETYENPVQGNYYSYVAYIVCKCGNSLEF